MERLRAGPRRRILIRTSDGQQLGAPRGGRQRPGRASRRRGEAVSAVLHDQAGRRGHWARTFCELRHHPVARRGRSATGRRHRGGAIFFFELPTRQTTETPRTHSKGYRNRPGDDRSVSAIATATPDLRCHRAVLRGDGVDVVLDRTAFYPTSGGQPFDAGTIGGARVLDVIDEEDGGVVHVAIAPIAPGTDVGAPSTGRAVSTTCSSTPASTCSRRHSIGCCRDRTESFHLGSRVVHHRPCARGVGAEVARR